MILLANTYKPEFEILYSFPIYTVKNLSIPMARFVIIYFCK